MEVGPRDGLQNERLLVDTINKIGFIEGLVASGLKRIEVTAFVNPKWIPPLADQVEVAKGIRRQKGVAYAALIPNMKGYEQAVATKMDEVAFVLAASDTHNLKNINVKTDAAFSRYAEVSMRAIDDNMPFRAYISCAFGCPYEGSVAVSRVVQLAKLFNQLGAYEVSIGDTIGIGDPKQTLQLVRALSEEISLDKIALHLHDTRGMALANIFAALSEGVKSFDASAGGLGGCPYAPGASGNVSTEDLVYMLQAMGIETGVNLDLLCNISLKMEKLLKRQLPSKVLSTKRLTS
jgi:hydroxymethylglutaryl-CoA lyase